MRDATAPGAEADAPADDQRRPSRSAHRRSLSDTLAGLIFAAIGLAFAGAAVSSYELGTPAQMGPGFFPMVLGGILVALGITIVVKGYIAGEETVIGEVPWRAVSLIIGAVVFFGATVRGLGLVPVLVATVFVAGLAGKRTGLVAPAVIAIALTVLSIAIFVIALGLRLPLFGTWFGA
jgi:hypothetical protein